VTDNLRLVDRLAAITSDLDAYLERRAAEIAAPAIAAAEEAAAAKVRQAEAETLRAQDLVDELRRQQWAIHVQLDDCRIRHGEKRDPWVVEQREARKTTR
jgi:hypothetical protein